MAVAQYVIGLTRQALAAKLAAVPGLAGVTLGSHLEEPTADFFAELWDPDTETSQPQVVVCPAQLGTTDAFKNYVSFTVEVKLYYGYPNFQDFDNTAIEDLYYALTVVICKSAGVAGAGNPVAMDPFRFVQEMHQDPVVALYAATVHYQAPIEGA